MARIISFQHCLCLSVDGCQTYVRQNEFTSINLETVQQLTGRHWGYSQKKVKVQRSFLGRLFKGEYDIVDDESRPAYHLRFVYKNRSQYDQVFLIDKEEYERLKSELARYGWTI